MIFHIYTNKFPKVSSEEALQAALFDKADINDFIIQDHKTCATTAVEERNRLTYEFLIQFVDHKREPLDKFSPRWVNYTFVVGNKSVFNEYCKRSGLFFMLSPEKPLTIKQKKQLKEKQLTETFGTDLTQEVGNTGRQ